jgi:DNA ligase 1
MDAKNFGSFSIANRLMGGLCTVFGPSDPTNRRQRLLQSFLEKYSTSPTDLTLLFELMTTELPPAGVALQSAPMLLGVLDDYLVGASSDALSIVDVPFASYGNLSILEAHTLCCQLRLKCSRGLVRSSDDDVLNGLLRSLPASVTSSEWETLKNIVLGCVDKTLGNGFTSIQLISFLGPVASSVYATQRSIRVAVVASCDGSPRMMRESSVLLTTSADDASAGFASDDDADNELPPPPLSKPTEVSSWAVGPGAERPVAAAVKRPREEDDGEIALHRTSPALHVPTPTAPPRTKQYPCMYGAACRRTNPDHFKKYSHPADHRVGGTAVAAPPPSDRADIGSAIAACVAHPITTSPPLVATPPVTHTAPAMPAPAPPSVSDPASFAIKGVVPLRGMKEYEFTYVENSGGGYKMKNCGGGTYTCNCPVWRYQNKATNERSCKHLEAYLGVAFERARCGDTVVDGGGTPASPRKGGAAPRAGSPQVGRKVAMPGVLLANKATNKGDYKGWWVSEKLDGVRAYWDGTHLLSRNGNIFTAPESFTKDLPKDKTLDGELFGGRKKFQTTVGIVKSSAAHPGWATLSYELFDIPSSGGKSFEGRMEELLSLFPKGGPIKHVHVVEQELCAGSQHVADRLAEIEALGGEGLMLREPGSKYVHSRSNTLLKVKSTEEVDAIVRGHDPGKGKHQGRCGALLVELANGKQFCVGSGLSDMQRNAPPSVGTVIVVRFQELTDGGIPRFPVFAGCRYDIDWPPKGK